MPKESGTSKLRFSLLLISSGAAAVRPLPKALLIVLPSITEVPSHVLRNYQIHAPPDQSAPRIRRLPEKTRRTPPRRTRLDAPTRKGCRTPPRTPAGRD